MAAQAYRAVALGDGRVRLAWAEADVFGPGEAASEAAIVLRQASGQSAAVSEAAEREAAEIRRLASAQSAAIRRAAELEAAELRAVIEMSARLGGTVSAAGDLVSPARPAARPERQLITQPAALPVAGLQARPGARTKGRQARAMRQAAVLMVALVLAGAASGTTEIARHGLPFFFFRNAGAGAGNSQNLDENQGPGQADAPGAHRPSPPARHPVPPRRAPDRHAAGRRRLLADEVVRRKDDRLVRLEACLLDERHQRLAEGLEFLG